MFSWVLVFAELAVAGFMFYLSYSLNEEQQVFKFLYFGLGLLLLILACYTVFLVGQVPGQRLSATNESSHVWNCSSWDTYCFGEPDPKMGCAAYDYTQCTKIDGCVWDANFSFCWGAPTDNCSQLHLEWGDEKCRETYGCHLMNESNPQTCDSYDIQYVYEEFETGYAGLAELMETVAWILAVLLGFFVMVVIIRWIEEAYKGITEEKKMPEVEVERPF